MAITPICSQLIDESLQLGQRTAHNRSTVPQERQYQTIFGGTRPPSLHALAKARSAPDGPKNVLC